MVQLCQNTRVRVEGCNSHVLPLDLHQWPGEGAVPTYIGLSYLFRLNLSLKQTSLCTGVELRKRPKTRAQQRGLEVVLSSLPHYNLQSFKKNTHLALLSPGMPPD